MNKTFISLFFSLLILIGLVQCRKSGKVSDSLNTLNVGLRSKIHSLDPAVSYDVVSWDVTGQVYEPLFEYSYLKRPYELQPLLSDGNPKVENNGTKYTFKIKKNVPYHKCPCFKGKKRFVKAQDFVMQIKRLAFTPTASKGWWLFDGRVKGLNEFRKAAGRDLEKLYSMPVSGLETPDDHTLIIHLTGPYPQFLYALALPFASPMPIEAVKHYKNDLTNDMVGTGPFEFVSWTRLSNLKLQKFKNYRPSFYPKQGDHVANKLNLLKDAGAKIPFVSKVHFHIIQEGQPRWLNFLKKKIDYIVLPKDNFSAAITNDGSLSSEMKKKDIKLQISPTLTYWWISFNMSNPVLGKNLNLRKAIAHAINVEDYIKLFTNNVGQKANSILPPGVTGYDPSAQLPYKFDLDKARQFLKDAGYPEGKGAPELVYDLRGNNSFYRQTGEFVKRALGEIGLRVQVVLNTFPAFLEKARKGKLQFWGDGWAMDYPDAENGLQLLYSKNVPPGSNTCYYNDNEFDKLYEEMRILPESDRKNELIKKMEAIVNRDYPWVMKYYARDYILHHNHLKNFRKSTLVFNFMKYIKLEKTK